MDTGARTCTHDNTVPLLHEIKHALTRLTRDNTPSVIDVTALPMTGEDLTELLDTLGKGEIEVTLESAGTTLIWETQYPGVWVTQHQPHLYNKSMTYIDICTVPTLLVSQQDDISEGLNRLQSTLT